MLNAKITSQVPYQLSFSAYSQPIISPHFFLLDLQSCHLATSEFTPYMFFNFPQYHMFIYKYLSDHLYNLTEVDLNPF